jgi:hypothetical protein
MLVATGGAQVAVTLLRVSTSRGDETISGSAVLRKDGNDAIARATLAALNRIIAQAGSTGA